MKPGCIIPRKLDGSDTLSYCHVTSWRPMVKAMFDVFQFTQLLPALDGKCHVFPELVSSNDTAREMIKSGAGSGTLVIAESQSGGRGRGGKRWQCPAGEGLLFSLVLEPDVPRAQWPRMALAAGVAVTETLRSNGLAAELKWPNDVWISGRKCAGILVESCEDFLIIGIGLNVNIRVFPPELTATSLALEGVTVSRESLLAEIIPRLIMWGSRIGSAFSTVVTAANRHCALHGKMISLHHGGHFHEGRMLGVDDHGHLLMEISGEIQCFAQADDIRPISGS